MQNYVQPSGKENQSGLQKIEALALRYLATFARLKVFVGWSGEAPTNFGGWIDKGERNQDIHIG